MQSRTHESTQGVTFAFVCIHPRVLLCIERYNVLSACRDWVFIPLTLCILLMKLLTQYANMVGLVCFSCGVAM